VVSSPTKVRFDNPLDDLFATPSSARVLRALHELPHGFGVSGREVARRAGVTHPTANKALGHFLDQGIVLVRRSPHGDEYRLNESHVLAEATGRLFDRERSLKDELVLFLSEAIQREAPQVAAAYLFGSIVLGSMEPNSDIDLAVVYLYDVDQRQIAAQIERVGDQVRKRFGNTLQATVRVEPYSDVTGLFRRDTRSLGLWDRIQREGVPIPMQRAKARSGDKIR
jgi:predicted nucleotidyltransferase